MLPQACSYLQLARLNTRLVLYDPRVTWNGAPAGAGGNLFCAAVVLASARKLCTGLAQVDVVHKRCMADGCTKHTSYNWPGERARLYCKLHALPGMVRLSTVNQAQSGMQNSITTCGVTGG